MLSFKKGDYEVKREFLGILRIGLRNAALLLSEADYYSN